MKNKSIVYEVIDSGFGSKVLKVSYNDLELIYDLTDFFKENTDLNSLFEFINKYMSTLNEEQSNEIFKEFVDVYKFYENNIIDINSKTFIEKIENKLAKICRIIDFDNFKIMLNWEENRIYIPENTLTEFVYDPDLTVTREKTYLKSEYLGLIALSLMFRLLLPVYIQYYNYIKHITNFYFYKIFILFIKTNLYVSEELNKLREYIENIQESLEETSKKDYLVIDSGFSMDDITDNIIAEVIFTKLINIDYFNKKINIVSYVFQTIKFKLRFTGSERGVLRSKLAKNEVEKDDFSYFEDYRKTSDISIGTVAELQYAYENLFSILNILKIEDFDFEEYNKELQKLSIFLTKKIHKIQIIMLGIFLNKYLNPRSLFYIENKKFYELLLLTRLILKKKNFKIIPVLFSSYEGTNFNIVQVSSFIKPNLKQIYSSLKSNYTFATSEEKHETIEKTIVEIFNNIYNTTWIPVCSKKELDEIGSKENILTIPSNFNDELIDYIKFCVNWKGGTQWMI